MKNLIFRKSSYMKSNFKKKKKNGTRVPCKISHITRFSLNRVFLLKLDFLKIEFFIETRFSKNRVSKQRHFARKFQNRCILLESFSKRDKCPFWPSNRDVNFALRRFSSPRKGGGVRMGRNFSLALQSGVGMGLDFLDPPHIDKRYRLFGLFGYML